MTNDRSSMEELAPAIDLDLATKLRDRGYRQKFFLAESSALIAEQLVALRKRRELSQKRVAELAATGQPAISRAEQADYQNWSFNTLRSLADVLDARLRILIEAAEDVLPEYEAPSEIEHQSDVGSNGEITGNRGDALNALYKNERSDAEPRAGVLLGAMPKSMNAANDDSSKPPSVLAAM
jgi:transcriptional regulator with XRE-family HTH domain